MGQYYSTTSTENILPLPAAIQAPANVSASVTNPQELADTKNLPGTEAERSLQSSQSAQSTQSSQEPVTPPVSVEANQDSNKDPAATVCPEVRLEIKELRPVFLICKGSIPLRYAQEFDQAKSWLDSLVASEGRRTGNLPWYGKESIGSNPNGLVLRTVCHPESLGLPAVIFSIYRIMPCQDE